MAIKQKVDFGSLVSESAMPMAEATQRTAATSQPPVTPPFKVVAPVLPVSDDAEARKTANLKPLTFKVSAAIRSRFKLRAAEADLKLNALLVEALEAWEEKHKLS